MGPIHNFGDQTTVGPSDSSFPTRKANVQPTEDQAQLAAVPLSAQLEQLQKTDAPRFQAVLSDAVRELRAAASTSSDPVEAAYLSDLANRFQWLEESGNAGAPSNSVESPSP